MDSSFERFRLDYGEGLIAVEMDDWDWYDEANPIKPGDRVNVYGRIDADLHQKRTIEADSVCVFDRNTYAMRATRTKKTSSTTPTSRSRAAPG